MQLRVVSLDGIFFEGDVEMVEFCTTEGNRGVLPGHMSQMCALLPGRLIIRREGEIMEAALSGGFALIRPDQIQIITEEAKQKTTETKGQS